MAQKNEIEQIYSSEMNKICCGKRVIVFCWVVFIKSPKNLIQTSFPTFEV